MSGTPPGSDDHAGALEDAEELLDASRPGERLFEVDDLPEHEIGESLLHRLHAARRARLHDGVELLDLRLADEVPNCVVRQEDLERRDPAGAVGGRQQGLRDDRPAASSRS